MILAIALPSYVMFYENCISDNPPDETTAKPIISGSIDGVGIRIVTHERFKLVQPCNGATCHRGSKMLKISSMASRRKIYMDNILISGLPLVVVGLGLFNLGLREGLMPLGDMIGRELLDKRPEAVPVIGTITINFVFSF